DLGLVVADEDVPTAAVFTQNRVRAAPVELSEANLKSGLARAIIVNSGNANACTGDKGAFDAAAMADYCARAVGCDKKRVLVASTFNAVSVDGDTSTNDCVFLMASGAAKNKPLESDSSSNGKGESFRKAVRDVLDELSKQIVRDGEGATHLVTLEVVGAPSVD